MYQTDNIVKQHMRKSLSSKMPIREEKLYENSKSGSLLDYAHCDIEEPENLREAFANFSPIFKNINVGGDHIRPFMKDYAKKEGLLTQRRRMPISS